MQYVLTGKMRLKQFENIENNWKSAFGVYVTHFRERLTME